MIHRLKFRVHNGSGQGKFVYNVREGSTHYLNESFRPAGAAPELAHYCVMVRNGGTTVSLLKSGASWNQQALSGPADLRPGHLLCANGVDVEILECPVPASVENDREVTRFLDLDALSRQAGAPVSTARTENAEIASYQPRSRAEAPLAAASDYAPITRAPQPEPAHFDEPDDKLVLPISYDEAPRPTPMAEERPSPAPAPAPAKPARSAYSDDPMRARQATLRKAGLVACAFAVLIFGAYKAAQRWDMNLLGSDNDDYTASIPRLRPIQRKVAAVPPPADTATRAPASQAVTPLAVVPMPVGAPLPKSPAPADLKAFSQAIDEGSMATITKLVEGERVSPDFALDDLGRSPFVRAAAAGRVTVMQYLLTKKVSTTATDYAGSNALMWAVINGHEKTVRFLLSLGLDPSAKRDDGKTSFQLAREYRQNAVAKVLHDQLRASNAAQPANKDDRKPASKP